MSRPGIAKEQKQREGAFIKRHFEKMQAIEPDLTQESLANEVGVSQGLIGQWFSGATAIPDRTALRLSTRLNFDAFELRPQLIDYLISTQVPLGRRAVIDAILKYSLEAEDIDFDRFSRTILAYIGNQPL